MKWPRRVLSTRGKVLPVAVFTFGAAFLLYSATLSGSVANANSVDGASVVTAPSATFPGTGLGTIADATACGPTPGTPLNVTFNATGLSGAPSAVDVGVTFGSPNHTWMGDVTATLIAPNGASHTLFGVTTSTSATGIGDSSDLGAAYVFSDTAPAPPSGGWWQEATLRGAAEVMTAGTYRTTARGGAGQTNPAPPTSINAAFAGVTNPNGTWTLRLTDGCTGDTGAVTAASLTITAGPTVSPDANADFDGDGKTDYATARASAGFAPEAIDGYMRPGRLGYSKLDERPTRSTKNVAEASPQAPPIFWWVLYNNAAPYQVFQLGDAATDYIVTEDFDGDHKDDIAVWTEAAATVANFKVLQSSTNTVVVNTFGQLGDDPAVVGDYDGDGKADAAVYRCPANTGPAGQCYFFYRGTFNNPAGNITYVPWGFGVDGELFPYVGDFDGDGKNDFCIQRTNPTSAGNGQFVMQKSAGGVEFISWGFDSDFLIPGDYDGDGKTDICVRRSNTPAAGQRTYFVNYRTGATSQIPFGITGDFSVPGDYDGDGKTDFAIWRPSSTPGATAFWIVNSSTGSLTVKQWGQCATAGTCDFAVAGWSVH